MHVSERYDPSRYLQMIVLPMISSIRRQSCRQSSRCWVWLIQNKRGLELPFPDFDLAPDGTSFGALFQVKICRHPPPPPQNCSHFHERCAQCWFEWKINSDFYFLSYGWLYLVFTIYGEKKFATHQKASRVWVFFLGLMDSSWNRLVSTAYQNRPGFSVLHA